MTMPTIEQLCDVWRAASDGAYLRWNQIADDSPIKTQERRQMAAVLDALKPAVAEAYDTGRKNEDDWEPDDPDDLESGDAYAARIIAQLKGESRD